MSPEKALSTLLNVANSPLIFHIGLDVAPVPLTVVPGDPLEFDWVTQQLSGPPWTSGTLQLLLADSGLPLWQRANFSFPPPENPSGQWVVDKSNPSIPVPRWEPVSWPPPGWFHELADLDAAAQRVLYSGFGKKILTLRFVAGQTTEEARLVVEVVPEDHVGTVTLQAPAQAPIGGIFTVGAVLSNNAALPMTVTGTLHTSGDTGNPPYDDAVVPSSVDAESQAVIPLAHPSFTWLWVDKPQYSPQWSNLAHQIQFGLTTRWTDPFGNVYGPIDARPATTEVRVTDAKRAYAEMAEKNFAASTFWAAVAAGTGVFDLGFTAVAAGAVSAYFALIYSRYAALADDPPTPDARYWAISLPKPEPVAEASGSESVSPALLRARDIAWLSSQFGVIYSRALGAAQADSADALRLQLDCLDGQRRRLSAALAAFSDLAAEFVSLTDLPGSVTAGRAREAMSAARALSDDELAAACRGAGVPDAVLAQVRNVLGQAEDFTVLFRQARVGLEYIVTLTADSGNATLTEAKRWSVALRGLLEAHPA